MILPFYFLLVSFSFSDAFSRRFPAGDVPTFTKKLRFPDKIFEVLYHGIGHSRKMTIVIDCLSRSKTAPDSRPEP